MKKRTAVRLVHGLSLAGMALGMALVVQPWYANGLRVGFFVTLGTTVIYIVIAHIHQTSSPLGGED